MIILRGLPGSGKSTLAKMLVSACGLTHVESDTHFTDGQGNYRFDPARVADAHGVCQRDADVALGKGARVVIANTHIRLWELAPYLGLSSLHACEWRVIECVGAWPNVHRVPEAVVSQMRDKFERLPAQFAAQVWRLD